MLDSFSCQGSQYRTKYRESEQTGISSNRTGVKENADDIAEEIKARKIQCNEIAGDLANFKTITANSISAVQGDIDDLTAIAITTQNLSAQTISANQISGGTVSGITIKGSTLTGVTNFMGYTPYWQSDPDHNYVLCGDPI